VSVVAVNVGSVSEAIIEGKSGFFRDALDRVFVSYLQKLVRDATLRRKFGLLATQSGIIKFRVENMIMKYEQLFEEILRK
jgi:glycosyltransferase involved in cell wall biosynthesis